MPRLSSPSQLKEFRQAIVWKREPNRPCIAICSGTVCQACGSERVNAAFEAEEVLKNYD